MNGQRARKRIREGPGAERDPLLGFAEGSDERAGRDDRAMGDALMSDAGLRGDNAAPQMMCVDDNTAGTCESTEIQHCEPFRAEAAECELDRENRLRAAIRARKRAKAMPAENANVADGKDATPHPTNTNSGESVAAMLVAHLDGLSLTASPPDPGSPMCSPAPAVVPGPAPSLASSGAASGLLGLPVPARRSKRAPLTGLKAAAAKRMARRKTPKTTTSIPGVTSTPAGPTAALRPAIAGKIASPNSSSSHHSLSQRVCEAKAHPVPGPAEANGCASLGDLLSLLSVSESHAWAEVRLPLLEEALDRKVFWACREHPALATLEPLPFIDGLTHTPGLTDDAAAVKLVGPSCLEGLFEGCLDMHADTDSQVEVQTAPAFATAGQLRDEQARTEARLGRAEAWFHEHMLLTVAADDAKAGQDDAMAVAADDAKAGAQDDPMAGALAVAPPTKTVVDLSAVDNGRLNRSLEALSGVLLLTVYLTSDGPFSFQSALAFTSDNLLTSDAKEAPSLRRDTRARLAVAYDRLCVPSPATADPLISHRHVIVLQTHRYGQPGPVALRRFRDALAQV